MTNPLLAQFIPEARDLIQRSVEGLLKLEGNPRDEATVNEVFRAVHTLKGSSGLFEVLALTKLVHAAEDLLGAVRLNEMQLDGELVDGLLDSLDRVNGWLDHLERHSALPSDADGVSATMAKDLREFFVPAAVKADPQPDAPVASTAPASAISWLAPFAENCRQDALKRLGNGEAVQVLRYRPNEGCFFNGTDPLGTMLQIRELLGLDVVAGEPFGDFDQFDPYRCILEYQALTTSSREELEHLFRYDLEEIEICALEPHDLVRLFGPTDHAIIWTDFHELAEQHLADDDIPALAEAAASLIEMMSEELRPVSALRWIRCAIECGERGRPLLAGLVAAVAEKTVPEKPVAAKPAIQVGPAQVDPAPDAQDRLSAIALPGGVAERMALRIAAAQRRILLDACDADMRVAAVARVLGGVGRALGSTAFAQAVTKGGMHPATIRNLLDDAFPVIAAAPAPVLAPSPTSASTLERAPAPDAPPPQSGAPHGPVPARQLKVDQAKIDLLMNLIGELIVSKNSLPFLAKRAEEVYGSRDMGREIKEQFAVIDRLAQEMQGAVMQVRMLPVSEVFVRFPRLVRDLSRKLGKRILLEVEGGETAADKTIIEALGDPLVHIMRNSLDHGIETADERRAVGKPEEARIRLKAYQEADSVVIEIADDGRGIDPARIRAAAVAKGVVTQDAAARLSDQESINLIYKPGFSTAKEISDLSGRGVGMDVVLTTVEKLGGSVSVTSTLGQGTSTRLSLPLSMAVTRVMVVEVAGALYGMPMDLIVETVRISRDHIRTIKRAETFVLRDTVIPLVRMATLLQLPPRAAMELPDEEAVLVCRVNGTPVGLVIDDFREGMEVLLKPLDGVIAHIPGYSGTALLGDGRVLLVLNLKELL